MTKQIKLMPNINNQMEAVETPSRNKNISYQDRIYGDIVIIFEPNTNTFTLNEEKNKIT